MQVTGISDTIKAIGEALTAVDRAVRGVLDQLRLDLAELDKSADERKKVETKELKQELNNIRRLMISDPELAAQLAAKLASDPRFRDIIAEVPNFAKQAKAPTIAEQLEDLTQKLQEANTASTKKVDAALSNPGADDALCASDDKNSTVYLIS